LNDIFRAIPKEEFQPLTYTSEREEGKPVPERTVYLGAERSWKLTDPKGKPYVVRRIFVISSEEQAACRKNRARQMEKAEAELSKVQKNLGTRWYDTPEKVREKVNGILRQRRVTALYRITVGGEAGTPTFHWERDEAAIAEAEALDGFYVLVTNLPADQYDASSVLQLYKGQYRVERRFGDFKGPLGVSPIFLKDNRRIASLVFVVYLALLIFCLLERQARRALEDPARARWEPLNLDRRRRRTHAIHDPAESGKIRWAVGEPAQRPTGANILERLRPSLVTILVVNGQRALVPPQLDPVLLKLHELLGVPTPFSY
jgi:transposase